MNKGAPQLWGTPTEIALVRAALDAGIDVIALRQQYPILRVQLRSTQRNYMVTWHATVGNELMAIKGAPDQVLAMCSHHLCQGIVQPLGDRDRSAL